MHINLKNKYYTSQQGKFIYSKFHTLAIQSALKKGKLLLSPMK